MRRHVAGAEDGRRQARRRIDSDTGTRRTPPTRLERIRPFTTHVVNPITRRIAGRAPGFAILHQRGRRSGRMYDTPMNVFCSGDAYVFALTFGSGVDWVRNVMAAGGCTMTARGRDVRLTDPELIVDPDRRLVPQPVRAFLGLLRVTEFLRMRVA